MAVATSICITLNAGSVLAINAYIIFYTFTVFINIIITIITIFAHNAKYDILVTGALKYLIINHNFRVENFSDSNPTFYILTQKKCPSCFSFQLEFDEKQTLCSECGLLFDNKHTLTKHINIISSTNFFQFSLKKLGEFFNLPKLEFDYSSKAKQNKEQEIEYCQRDVEILQKSILTFISFLQKENLGGLSFTVAGQAMRAFRKKFMDTTSKPIYIHNKKESIILERQGYNGGRNEAWTLGKIKHNLYIVDVNAMYSFVMKSQKYPTKLISYRYRNTIQMLENFLEENYLIIVRLTLKTNIPVYPKNESKLLFPVGVFETTLSTPELKFALHHKHILKVHEVAIYEGNDIFTSYIDYFYKKRLEAKASKDAVNDLLYKLFMNSLYGKFGQKNIHWEKIGEAPISDVYTETIVSMSTSTVNSKNQTQLSKSNVAPQHGARGVGRDVRGVTVNVESTHKVRHLKVFGGGVFERVDLGDGESESENSFPAIATHVTAYGRMLLWSYIEIAGRENIDYMDTDSLFLNQEGFERLERAGVIDNERLGALKLEKVVKDCVIRGCKDYQYIEIKSDKKTDKIKGVTKTSKKIDENNFASVVWGGLSGFVKKGDLEGYHNNLMLKKLKREYEKGDHSGEGRVEPFVYENNERKIENLD
jgi:hypothetical protein